MYIFKPLEVISELSFGKITSPNSPAVVDGNPHNCWSSVASINPWWSVDLGRYAFILAVRIVKSSSGKYSINWSVFNVVRVLITIGNEGNTIIP